MTSEIDTPDPEVDDVSYGADHLQVLKGLDAVRKRPAMYIFDTGARGIGQLAAELGDNSVDEALAGHATKITIMLHSDGSVEITDNGRGIPVDVNKAEGITGLELVFQELHGGGKFGGGAYGASGGLHGVGASVVNALSAKLIARVDRGGKTHQVTYDHGIAGVYDKNGKFIPQQGLQIVGTVPKGQTGTRVRYWPDMEIFEEGSVTDYQSVVERARQTAFLVPGLEMVIVNDREGEKETQRFKFDGGMSELVDFLAPDRPLTNTIAIKGTGTFVERVPMPEGNKMVVKDIERTMEVEIALRWGIGYESTTRSFVNIVTTPKGGTHVAGFERALNKIVNEQMKTLRVANAKDENVIKDDILEGLTAVVLVRVSEPQFEGQTKEILGTTAATGIVNQVVSEKLKAWFADPANKQQAKTALEKVKQAAKTRLDARKHKETLRRKNALESSSMPDKLADCRSTDLERTEILIIEGDSAGGTVKAARDSEFQAVMPIRGKILNTMKASEKQMLDNLECAGLITAMGAGSGKSFDIESIRYGKFIILTDADVDGSHIRCLLLTLCWRYMRPLIEAGRVYSAVPPLHRVTESMTGKQHYTYSQEQMEAKVAEIEKAGGKVKEIQRYKGLGEMDPDQLADTTMDMNTRQLRRITLPDAEEATLDFEMLMGQDVAGRKEFIVEFGGLLDPELIDV